MVKPIKKKTLGEFWRKLRLRAGLTQEQAASQIGVSVRTIARWEAGKKGNYFAHREALRVYEAHVREREAA